MVSLYRCQILNRHTLEELAEGGGSDEGASNRIH
jgi:hypothetical protein